MLKTICPLWNKCDKGCCHTCSIPIVTVVPQFWNSCDNLLWNNRDNRHGTVVTIGILTSITCVLLAHYYRLTDKFAVSLSVSVLTD